jgi:hypothetical protein
MKSLKTLNAGVTDSEKSNQTFNSNSTPTTSPSMHTNTITRMLKISICEWSKVETTNL